MTAFADQNLVKPALLLNPSRSWDHGTILRGIIRWKRMSAVVETNGADAGPSRISYAMVMEQEVRNATVA